jgi:hypothetical protein
MEMLAPYVGGDRKQYRLVGLLHDVDYLEAPHDLDEPDDREDIAAAGEKENVDIHPSLVVKEMALRGAPLEMTLAILEHAPHARLRDVEMSPMSQALYFADNFATCKSAGCKLGDEPYPRPANMPAQLWDDLMALEIPSIIDTKTASPGRWKGAAQAIEEVFSRDC